MKSKTKKQKQNTKSQKQKKEIKTLKQNRKGSVSCHTIPPDLVFKSTFMMAAGTVP